MSKPNESGIKPAIPTATYRLQFNAPFTFDHAAALVPYLYDLGITSCYASPLLMARAGSLHGYDVVDHTKLNPELGGREGFVRFAGLLRQRGMGLIMDVVPNHMCIAGSGNQWWGDILENGPGSPYARFFDIDWNPPKAGLADKVLLPILGDQYGRVLENQEIQLAYQRGAFFVNYYGTRLPIAPRTSINILQSALENLKTQLEEAHPHVLELESIITALNHLPPRTEIDVEKVRERRREKEIIKRRLSSLIAASREAQRAIQKVVREYNGNKGHSRSFDKLEELLASQPYWLSFWRVAADEINYRRFFDVNELAAIRVEEPEVFAEVHQLVFRLMREGWVNGLRIDHVDGLLDPKQYLDDLQREALRALEQLKTDTHRKRARIRTVESVGRPCYIVIEKILEPHERLQEDWAIYGTTGYDFLNLLNGLFVESRHERVFRRLYQRLTGLRAEIDDLIYESKKLILQVAMSSELQMLARKIDQISEQHRYSRDFTFNSLQSALSEVIACFPVYRTYLRQYQKETSDADRRHVAIAIHQAKRRNASVSPSIFDFIASLLLSNQKDLEGLDEAQRAGRRDFVMRFQQLTGPVTAKGIEDTTFYRYYPLASLNEVGGDLLRFGITPETFHQENAYRLAHWPHTLVATSTHDTKRSEDVRARINALSEIPVRWYRAVRRWQNLNRHQKTIIDGQEAPDANEEYLLYQTLVGTWPLSRDDESIQSAYAQRIAEYLIKAIREAKNHSSWINPNEAYEQAVRDFIKALLEPGNPFLEDFADFQAPITRAGMFNSLSQVLLKITVPGVPDFYQGTELWDFSLVDPDNRRQVDYENRRLLLARLHTPEAAELSALPALADELARSLEDGRIKLYLTSRLLNYRREHRELFESGEYRPLQISGEKHDHLISFARVYGDKTVIIIATRFFTRLVSSEGLPIGEELWNSSSILMDKEFAGCYRDLLTGNNVCTQVREDTRVLRMADVFRHLPFALLERIEKS